MALICHAYCIGVCSQDCGLSVFLILLLTLSLLNADGPDGRDGADGQRRHSPCACSCMPLASVWLMVALLVLACTRVVWILMVAIPQRVAAQQHAAPPIHIPEVGSSAGSYPHSPLRAIVV